MKSLRLIMGDQLSREISALEGIAPDSDVVLMAEVLNEVTFSRHHKQKIVLVLSAMRNFAKSLSAEGINVDYICLDEAGNTGSLYSELKRALDRHQVEKVIITEPGEWRVWELIQKFTAAPGIEVEIREDNRFLCKREEFSRWAAGRKTLRMEHFYRWMRRRTGHGSLC